MGASIYYLFGTLAILVASWKRNQTTYEGALVMLWWFIMANLAYRFGVIESVANQISMLIFCGITYYLWLHRCKALFGWLFLIGAVTIFWTLAAVTMDVSAYDYKYGKNLLYLAGLVAVCLSWRRRSSA